MPVDVYAPAVDVPDSRAGRPCCRSHGREKKTGAILRPERVRPSARRAHTSEAPCPASACELGLRSEGNLDADTATCMRVLTSLATGTGPRAIVPYEQLTRRRNLCAMTCSTNGIWSPGTGNGEVVDWPLPRPETRGPQPRLGSHAQGATIMKASESIRPSPPTLRQSRAAAPSGGHGALSRTRRAPLGPAGSHARPYRAQSRRPLLSSSGCLRSQGSANTGVRTPCVPPTAPILIVEGRECRASAIYA